MNKTYTEEEVQELLAKERKKIVSSVLEHCGCSDLDQVYSLAKIGSYTNSGKKILGLNNANTWSGNPHESYLEPLSKEARQLILSNKPNIYHSVMAVLNNQRCRLDNPEELLKAYLGWYGAEKPYLVENQKLVLEIITLCINNYKNKRKAR